MNDNENNVVPMPAPPEPSTADLAQQTDCIGEFGTGADRGGDDAMAIQDEVMNSPTPEA